MKWLCRSASIGILALLASACGSGDPLGVGVSGTVTYKGKPIKEGLITFIPTVGTQGPKAGANIDEGQYSIPRRGALAPGKYRVEIRAFEESGKEIPKSMRTAQMFGRPVEQVTNNPGATEQLEKLKKEKKNVIPARYNDDSELSRELPDQSEVAMDFEI